jgi:ribosome-binding factor A
VYYTVLGEDDERKATAAGLRSAGGHLRAVIGREVRLKFLPELEFHEDRSLARAERVDELLRKARGEGDDAAD